MSKWLTALSGGACLEGVNQGFGRFMRHFVVAIGAAFFATFSWLAAASDLTISEGVVVKFGTGAELVVRDGISAKKAVFTSAKDDSVLGRIGSTAQIPAPGDWAGLRLEASAALFGQGLQSLRFYYGGGNGAAAFSVRENSHTFNNFLFQANTLGVRIDQGAAVNFSGLSLITNQTGLEVDGSAQVTVNAGSEIRGNSIFGISNKTPATVVQAQNNWWGHPSGPYDPVANSAGQGDKVSTGVNYGAYLLAAPLIDCSVQLLANSYSITDPNIQLLLVCRNAVEYRLSEFNDFANGSFATLGNQPATVPFTLSPTLGSKNVYVQFRNVAGGTLVVSLPQSITLNPSTIAIAITSPPAGSEITSTVAITATATDPVGIEKVDFYIDNTLFATDNQTPYAANLNPVGLSDGDHLIKAVATNVAGERAQDVRSVRVRLLSNDTTGPSIGDIRYDGVVLVTGATLNRHSNLSVAVSDSSGVNRVEIKIDDQLLSGSFSGGSYFVSVDLNRFANGLHTLSAIATDNAGNSSRKDLSISINLPSPEAPVIIAPQPDITIQQASIVVAGTAQPYSQVQVYLNGVPVGNLININAQGRFETNLTLTAEGSYLLKADARNSRGTGPATAERRFEYQAIAPIVSLVSPAAGATLYGEALIQAFTSGNDIAEVFFYVDGQELARLTAPPYQIVWNSASAPSGAHTLKAVVTSRAGKTGESSRVVNTQPASPPPPPPAYMGEISDVTPIQSFGNQVVTINGRAKDRTTSQSVASVPVQMVLMVNGFKRKINVVTDADGKFSYRFIPQQSDGGNYEVSVIHPNDTEMPVVMGRFTINQLKIAPSRFSLTAARGIGQNLAIDLSASAGSGINGIHLEARADEQPSGSIPAGINTQFGNSIDLRAGESNRASVSFTADSTALEIGTLILGVYAANEKLGSIVVEYRLVNPTAVLFTTPSLINTGVAQGQQVTETIAIDNRGVIPATAVQVQLLDAANNPPPSWIYLATVGSLGDLDLGQKQTVQITAAPPAGVNDGVYAFKLRLTSGNANGSEVPIAVRVTPSGVGSVRFKIEDIYTSTNDSQGNRILGLADARVTLQSETNPTLAIQTVNSDNNGVATINNLPAGRYLYRVNAFGHVDSGGRLLIKSGVTIEEDVFLDSSLVTVDFSVSETTILDRYDVKLDATYQTEVPAPVVLIEPGIINIPVLQVGEEATGEITITNYGLVRADHVKLAPFTPSEYFHIELMGEVPSELAAKQRITLLYKITALKPLPGDSNRSSLLKSSPVQNMSSTLKLKNQAVTDKTTTRQILGDVSAACLIIGFSGGLTYDFICANGTLSSASAPFGAAVAIGFSCGSTGVTPVFIGPPPGDITNYFIQALGGVAGAISNPDSALNKCIPGCNNCCSWR